MEKILSDLNKGVGIAGSMIMTKDGEFVIGKTMADIEESAAAALAANIIRGCQIHLGPLDKANFTQFIIESTQGKVVIYDAGLAYLFVICNQQIRLNMTILDIKSAAMRIQKELA